jgi:outer membrane protein insertion porin family
LRNPDGTVVPKDPSNPLRGGYTVPVPVDQIVFPGGDASVVANLEYRITIAGPVAVAPFLDMGMDPILRPSQLRVQSSQLSVLNATVFGCPAQDLGLNCVGGIQPGTTAGFPAFSQYLKVAGNTNWTPRMSTGIELQVFLPVVNAPFRIYYAYNPLRLDTFTQSPVPITRSMFPAGAAGDYTYLNTVGVFAPQYRLREPRKTFRFTVATTF